MSQSLFSKETSQIKRELKIQRLSKKKDYDKDFTDFASHILVEGIPNKALRKIFSKCTLCDLEKGDILLSPGEINQHLYLILTGSFLVFLNEIGSRSSFKISEGEYLGEMSVIEETETSAFVVANEESRLVGIPRDIFWDQIATYPTAMRNMLKIFSQRMRNQNKVTQKAFENQLHFEHLQKEIKAAAKIQASILPEDNPLFPEFPQVEAFALMKPAQQVGGDFYDAFDIDDDHVCIAIGDVSGKGLASALFMVRTSTLLRMSLLKKKNFKSVVSRVNKMLTQNNKECNFVTLFVGMLNVKTGILKYFNGGHNAPFVSHNGQPFELLPLPAGVLLGYSDQVEYDIAEAQLSAGDTIILYTDGITEAESRKHTYFSTERALELVNEIGSQKPPSIYVKQLRKAVAKFSKKMPQSDDITLLALTYHGSKQNS